MNELIKRLNEIPSEDLFKSYPYKGIFYELNRMMYWAETYYPDLMRNFVNAVKRRILECNLDEIVDLVREIETYHNNYELLLEEGIADAIADVILKSSDVDKITYLLEYNRVLKQYISKERLRNIIMKVLNSILKDVRKLHNIKILKVLYGNLGPFKLTFREEMKPVLKDIIGRILDVIYEKLSVTEDLVEYSSLCNFLNDYKQYFEDLCDISPILPQPDENRLKRMLVKSIEAGADPNTISAAISDLRVVDRKLATALRRTFRKLMKTKQRN